MQQIEWKGKQHLNLQLITVWYQIASCFINIIYKKILPRFSGNPDIVSLLVKFGANVNEMLSNRWTPLLWSIENNNENVTEILIKNGANVNHIGIEDKTALHVAAERVYERIAELLVQNGANVM